MCREEVEVRFARKDFEKLIKLLKVLGFKVRIVWLRRRLVFDWNGTRVYLDDTEGYGRIIELEHYTKSTKEKPEKTLIERLNKLGVKLSQRKEFEERFSWYERHWKELIGGKLKELGLGFLLS
jgi:predicted adenylyl cyclase CyaB